MSENSVESSGVYSCFRYATFWLILGLSAQLSSAQLGHRDQSAELELCNLLVWCMKSDIPNAPLLFVFRIAVAPRCGAAQKRPTNLLQPRAALLADILYGSMRNHRPGRALYLPMALGVASRLVSVESLIVSVVNVITRCAGSR